MRRWIQALFTFLNSEDGPTSVEYAVMLSLIVVVCLVSITSFATYTSTTFGKVSGKIAGS
jgi:pilus assembly protein Flp/PilA